MDLKPCPPCPFHNGECDAAIELSNPCAPANKTEYRVVWDCGGTAPWAGSREYAVEIASRARYQSSAPDLRAIDEAIAELELASSAGFGIDCKLKWAADRLKVIRARYESKGE